MSAIHLRAMQWPDITEVHAIETSVFAVDHWSVEQFWSELAQPTRHYVVAVDHGVIVGYAGCFVLPPDADVQTIAVSPAATGRGVGTALLQWLVACASRSGCAQLLLEVHADNAKAIGLYERAGFERISIRRDYYAPGVDAHIMRLRPLARVVDDEQ